MLNGGDALARGAKKVAFGPPKVSAKRWAEIWADEDEIAVQEESKKQESKKK